MSFSAGIVRRAVTVSTGALALCLLSAGAAAADTTGLPPLPSPDNVITTLDQTVTSVTSGQTTTTPTGTTTPTTTTPTTSTPTSTTPTTGTPTTTTKSTVTKTAVRRPAATTTVVRHHASAPAGSTSTTTYTAMMPAPMAGDLALPPATGVTSAAGQAPAVAPLLIPQVTHPISPAAAMIEADKHTGSPIRGILLTLAIAAALGVGYEHVRVVAREMRV